MSRRWGPTLVVAIGIARLLRLVLHDPVLGYADNFDFHRIANWYGWVPADPHIPVPGGHPEAPLATYLNVGERAPELWSSSLVLVEIAAQLHRLAAAVGMVAADRIDIRFVGLTRAAVLGLSAALGVWSREPVARGVAWGVALLFAIVIADPTVTLYANTLYGDFDAVVFLFVASAALLRVQASAVAPTGAVAAAAASLALLGAIKPQHAALPLAMVSVMAAAGLLRRLGSGRRGRVLGALLVVAAAAPIPMQLAVLSGRGPVVTSMKLANSANTWFGAVLPSLNDPPAALAELHLPARCERNIGKSWYDENVEIEACRGIGHVGRTRMIPLFLREPRALLRLLDRGLRETVSWTHDGLGQVAGRPFGRIDALGDGSLLDLTVVPRALGVDLYVAWVKSLLAAGAAVVGVILAGALARRPRTSVTAAATSLAAVTVSYSLASSVFGDGYVELTKHFLLGRIALLPMTALLLVWGVRALARWKGSAWRW